MTQSDFWQHRFEAVARDLRPEAAAIVLDLLTEDADRFRQALRSLIATSDMVVCECAEADCLAGPHGGEHWARAYWRATQVEDGEDDYIHVCTPCKVSREQRPDASRIEFERMD